MLKKKEKNQWINYYIMQSIRKLSVWENYPFPIMQFLSGHSLMQSWKNEGEAKTQCLKILKNVSFKIKSIKAFHLTTSNHFCDLTNFSFRTNETFQDFLKHCAKRYKKFLLSSVVLLIWLIMVLLLRLHTLILENPSSFIDRERNQVPFVIVTRV